MGGLELFGSERLKELLFGILIEGRVYIDAFGSILSMRSSCVRSRSRATRSRVASFRHIVR